MLKNRMREIAAQVRQEALQDAPVEYAIGETAACPSSSMDYMGFTPRDRCYQPGYDFCDLDRISGSLLNQAGGAAFGPLIVAPTVAPPYFQAVAAEFIVTENGNPNALTRIRLTSLVVGGGRPMWAFDNRAPVVGTLQFVYSDAYPPDQEQPKPIAPMVIGVAALNLDAQYFGFNPQAVAADINVQLYGIGLSALPNGVQVGGYAKAIPKAAWFHRTFA